MTVLTLAWKRTVHKHNEEIAEFERDDKRQDSQITRPYIQLPDLDSLTAQECEYCMHRYHSTRECGKVVHNYQAPTLLTTRPDHWWGSKISGTQSGQSVASEGTYTHQNARPASQGIDFCYCQNLIS